MTHVKALQAGHSSQGTSELITPALLSSVITGITVLNYHPTVSNYTYVYQAGINPITTPLCINTVCAVMMQIHHYVSGRLNNQNCRNLAFWLLVV